MRKKLLLIFFGLVVVLVGFTVFNSFQAKKSSDQARKFSDAFVNSVLAGEAAQTYAQFSPEAQNDTAEADWQDSVNQFRLFFDGEHPSFASIKDVSGSHVFSYTIQGLDGKYTFQVVTTQVNGKWYAQSFTSKLQA